jgi:hypothetical protein
MKLLEYACLLGAAYLLGHVIAWGIYEHFQVKTIQLNPDRGWSTPYERAEAYRRAI